MGSPERAAEAGARPGDGAAPLDASLLREPPDPLAVGAGTVLFAEGRCEAGVDPGSLRLCLGSALSGPVEIGPGAPGDHGAQPTWWCRLAVPAGFPEGPAELQLRGRIAERPVAASLATLNLVERDAALAPPAPSVVAGEQGLIAICMATHEPEPERLARQLDSIRAQDWPSWVCVISDDASSAGAWTELQRLTADDERFIVSRSETRLGFYRNFERSLRLAPVEATMIALSDQDDEWDPDKLTTLRATLTAEPAARLAYSDMRIRDERGELLSDTYWILRRNRWDDIASLLVANTVTGAASLFRRELLEVALPFPPPVASPYHDHWLALCALATGELAYLDRPTYTRVRHLDSVTAETGHARALRALRGDGGIESEAEAPAPVRDPGAVYRGSFQQLAQFAEVLELRLGPEIQPGRRRVLARFARAERSLLAPLWLALRSLRPLIGRNETLGRERALAAALLWRRRQARRARR